MNFVKVLKKGEIAIVQLSRGKVNALNDDLVEQMHRALSEMEAEDSIRALILTGSGKFFTFGFDIPEFMNHSKDEFSRYLINFTNLYGRIFVFAKPVIAALNGHTIAGGCMIASACDYRLMVRGKAKISLNEISFGSTVFAGNTSILKYCVSARNAQKILYSGKMYTAEEALGLGLVDEVTSEDDLLVKAEATAMEFAAKDPVAFRGIKQILRRPVLEEIARFEKGSIEDFVEIWYSERTRTNLSEIRISP
jgi:3,2-trans-enoyl-CoA isomerase